RPSPLLPSYVCPIRTGRSNPAGSHHHAAHPVTSWIEWAGRPADRSHHGPHPVLDRDGKCSFSGAEQYALPASAPEGSNGEPACRIRRDRGGILHGSYRGIHLFRPYLFTRSITPVPGFRSTRRKWNIQLLHTVRKRWDICNHVIDTGQQPVRLPPRIRICSRQLHSLIQPGRTTGSVSGRRNTGRSNPPKHPGSTPALSCSVFLCPGHLLSPSLRAGQIRTRSGRILLVWGQQPSVPRHGLQRNDAPVLLLVGYGLEPVRTADPDN